MAEFQVVGWVLVSRLMLSDRAFSFRICCLIFEMFRLFGVFLYSAMAVKRLMVSFWMASKTFFMIV